MGRRKRSRDDDDYNDVMKKIRRLEKEVKKKRRRRLPSTSSSDNNGVQRDDYSPVRSFPDEAVNSPDEPLIQIEVPLDGENGEKNPEEDSQMDPLLLDILGGNPSVEKTFDENVHKNLANIWTHILLNGISKEVRTDLMKTYLPPENCPSFKAPKLNLEIKAALNEINNKKDLYSQTKQNQLGSCLAALGKSIDIALSSGLSQDVIKPMCDAGRLLCDYHHKESLSRRYAIINILNKQTKDVIKYTKIDEYLFGSDLAEHLKSSKAISKSGMELRPPPVADNRPKTKQNMAVQPPAARRGALNVRGALLRAAAAAEPRANPALRRPPPAASRNLHRDRYPTNDRNALPPPPRHRNKRY